MHIQHIRYICMIVVYIYIYICMYTVCEYTFFLHTLFPFDPPTQHATYLETARFLHVLQSNTVPTNCAHESITEAYRHSTMAAMARRPNITSVPPTDNRSVLIGLGVKLRTPELPTMTAPGVLDGLWRWTAMFERNLTGCATLSLFKHISLAKAATNTEKCGYTLNQTTQQQVLKEHK